MTETPMPADQMPAFDAEAVARAICKALGQDPDQCINGSGVFRGDGTGEMQCHERAWQRYIGAAHAAYRAGQDAATPAAPTQREESADLGRWVDGRISACVNGASCLNFASQEREQFKIDERFYRRIAAILRGAQ